MPPRHRHTGSPPRLKQQTLSGFLKRSPSPPPSIDAARKPTPQRSPAMHKRKGRLAAKSVKSYEEMDEGNTSSDVDAIHLEPCLPIVISSDEEEAQPSRRPKRTRRQSIVSGFHPASKIESRTLLDATHDNNNSSDAATNWKGKGIARRRHDDSDSESPLKRRKLIKGTRPSSQDGSDELLDDIDEAGQWYKLSKLS